MPKRGKQATLQVAPGGRVELTAPLRRRSRQDDDRELSPASQARADRAYKAQQSTARHHRPTWTEQQEDGRLVDDGDEVSSSSGDDRHALVQHVELVEEEHDRDSDDATGERARLSGGRRKTADGKRDKGPQGRSAVSRSGRQGVKGRSDDGSDDEIRVQPVASTSKAPVPSKSSRKPLSKSRSIETSPPTKRPRRTDTPDFEVVIESAARKKTVKPGSTNARAGPKQKNGAPETSKKEMQTVANGTSDSEDDMPVRRSSGSPRKRPRVASSPEQSSSGLFAEQSSAATSDEDAKPATGKDADGWSIPPSIAKDNKRLKAKRETTMNNAALRGPGKKGKRRKVDTKRRLTTLSQGVRDRRSADEASDEENFVVEDDEAIVYDTPTDEDEAPRRAGRNGKNGHQRKKSKKGKARAVSSEESSEELSEPAGKKSRRRSPSSASEEEVVTSARRKGKQSKGKRAVESESDSGLDEEPVRRKGRPRRARSRSGEPAQRHARRSDTNSDDDEEDEEPDDLEILDEKTVLDDRFRKMRSNEGKFAALRAMRERRKRAGHAIVIDSEDEEPARRSPQSVRRPAASSQPRFLGDPDHHSSDDSDDSSSEASGTSSETSSVSDHRDSMDEFLAEDDGNNADVVAEFRANMQTKMQGMRWNYKQYLAFLVYQIMDPDRDWRKEQPELRSADQRVSEALQGIISSVSSSAWTPRFKHVIDSRPELIVDDLPPDEAGGACEVCSMGRSRHATSVLTLRGAKYNRKSLKDLLPAEDSSAVESSDSDEEHPSVRKSRDKYYEFHSGVACTSRAQMYHDLRHWAYSTRNRVADLLAQHRRPVKVVKITKDMTREEARRARAVTAERKGEEAARLLDVLDRKGVIDDFASKLQRELDLVIKNTATNR